MVVNEDGVPPPWEVLQFVSGHMDAKTLATASCVSKTWSLCFSKEHLWRSLFTVQHTALFAAATVTSSSISYRHLYSVAESAAKRRLRIRQPPKPNISLSDLTFIVQVRNSNTNMVFVKEGKDMKIPSHGMFMFNIDVEGFTVFIGNTKEARVTWNVVFREWESVFTMTDDIRSLEYRTWIMDDLPAPEYCIFTRGSGLAADVTLELTGNSGLVNVQKLVLGITNSQDWMTLTMEDGLRYLEHFLLQQSTESKKRNRNDTREI